MIGISIIIPVYNAFLTLDRCLESIMEQAFQNFEVILVNDGSKDDSLQKLEEWQSKCDKIHVINQDNRGSGPARNNGLKYAKGKYVMFIDPDDWIEKNMLQLYWDKAEENGVDLVISGNVSDNYKNGILVSNDYDYIDEFLSNDIDETRKEYLNLFNKGLIRGPVCKLYKNEIINKNNIIFPDLRRSQDMVFNYRYYDKISSIYVFDSSLYHYVRDVDAQARKIPKDYYIALSMIFTDIMNLLNKWNVKINKTVYNDFCNYLFDALLFQLQFSDISDVLNNIINDSGIRQLAKAVKPKSVKRNITKYLIIFKQTQVLHYLLNRYQEKYEIRKI